MEAGTKYALHDDEERPLWAARVRLTPELLDKLRSDPKHVMLKLNVAASDGASKTRSATKKTSLMTVKLAGDEETREQYELLSFAEDPSINHLCTFRREDNGYHIYRTGAIHQKLLVQRLLDDTEKDRIKDKHAKSVLASKSRASKLIDTEPTVSTKRPRVMARMNRMPSTKASTGSSAWAATASRKRKLVLPSALSMEDAQEAKERIEKGFEAEVEDNTALLEDTKSHGGKTSEDDDSATIHVNADKVAAARENAFHDLFSSDSDGKEQPAKRLKRREPKKATRDVPAEKPRGNAVEKSVPVKSTGEGGNQQEVAVSELDTSIQPKDPSTNEAPVPSSPQSKNKIAPGRPAKAQITPTLPPVKASGGEVKRARVRSNLLPASRLPDLSFFPSVVVEICQRLAKHQGRSAILDDNDYNAFAETHEQFRRDWEMLDKVYSIAIIKTEGLHLQLEAVSTDALRDELTARIQASPSRKEGLIFVRDAMESIKKILHSIQTSIHSFDIKQVKQPKQ